MTTPGYRELTVSKVQLNKDDVDVSFLNCEVNFNLPNNWLQEHGVNPCDITVGRNVLIQGKGEHGNEDSMLCSPDPLNDFKLQ